MCRIDDHEYYGHNDDDEAAKAEILLVGILLILIGLLKELISFFEVGISFFHFL